MLKLLSNHKVIGLTPIGSTLIFSSELPMSLTDFLKQVFTRLKIHRHIPMIVHKQINIDIPILAECRMFVLSSLESPVA